MMVNICANGKAVQSWDTNEKAIDGLKYDMQGIVETKVSKWGKKVTTYTMTAATFVDLLLNVQRKAMAAPGDVGTHHIDMYSKLLPIINLVQDLALPVGIVVASWGMIELMIGNPGGKNKLKMSLIGYAGMFLVPMLFRAIHDALAA